MEVKKNKIYKHYRGDLYLVLDIALHTETEEELVIYRALYESCSVFARPLASFSEKLTSELATKYNQEYRFQLMSIPSQNKKYHN